jgi:DNA-binding IclR family transcriptional regulator
VEPIVSGVGVLDKAMAVLGRLEAGPMTVTEVVASTGYSRATVYRLVVALEDHGLVRRDGEGRLDLGWRLVGLGQVAVERSPWWEAAMPVLFELQEATGESVQLYVREGDRRVCVASLESPHGLRWIVPVGSVLPLDRGSAGRILATAPDPLRHPLPGDPIATESISNRRRRWVESVEEREAGVASVSAAVHDGDGQVVAAVSVSGPLERLTRAPGRLHGALVVAAAQAIEHAIGASD